MSWHRWTTPDCLAQLRATGVRVELTSTGKVHLTAPDGIDLRPMLPVVRKYRDGIVHLLSHRTDGGAKPVSRESSATPVYSAEERKLLAVAPEALRETVDGIKHAFTDGATVVDVRRMNEQANFSSDGT